MIVSNETVERLSRYRAALRRLKTMGLVRLFSDNLGDAAGVSASQVRKDFQAFGIRGVRRGGYQVAELAVELDAILGVDGPMKVVLVGCGHIGGALLRTYSMPRDGLSIVAGFDVDPAVINPEATPPILDVRELADYVVQLKIQVAVLAVPEKAIPHILELLRGTGVRGILNFAPVPLRDSEDWIVRNIDIRMEIEKLFHHIGFSGFQANAEKTAN